MTVWRIVSGTLLISRSSCSIGLVCRVGVALQGLVEVVHVGLVMPVVVDLHRHRVDGRLQGVGGVRQRGQGEAMASSRLELGKLLPRRLTGETAHHPRRIGNLCFRAVTATGAIRAAGGGGTGSKNGLGLVLPDLAEGVAAPAPLQVREIPAAVVVPQCRPVPRLHAFTRNWPKTGAPFSLTRKSTSETLSA